MGVVIYSSKGCIRCDIVKKFLLDKKINYKEFDIKTENGNECFKEFYKKNRDKVRRDASGIFFPIIVDGDRVVQDAGSSLDWFITGSKLGHMIQPNNLGHGWIGGLDISHGDHSCFDPFVLIVTLLKQGGLNIEITTNGSNPDLLEIILRGGLVDRILLNVNCESVCNYESEVFMNFIKSISALSQYLGKIDMNFNFDISSSNEFNVISVQDFANLIERITKISGHSKFPLFIMNKHEVDNKVNMFSYRTAARRWQNIAEIYK